jgi:hypothetical protein
MRRDAPALNWPSHKSSEAMPNSVRTKMHEATPRSGCMCAVGLLCVSSRASLSIASWPAGRIHPSRQRTCASARPRCTGEPFCKARAGAPQKEGDTLRGLSTLRS